MIALFLQFWGFGGKNKARAKPRHAQKSSWNAFWHVRSEVEGHRTGGHCFKKEISEVFQSFSEVCRDFWEMTFHIGQKNSPTSFCRSPRENDLHLQGRNPSVFTKYHCHHMHYRPEKMIRELFPAILDRIITGKYAMRIDLIVIRAHHRKHVAVHRSHDTRTKIPWTKSCNELPDENSPTINSVIFDR